MPRLRIHDPFQLELKRDLPLDASRRGARAPLHTLEVWFWVPGQLGLDEPVFHREAFYRDLTAYVRFHTPRASDISALLGRITTGGQRTTHGPDGALLVTGGVPEALARIAAGRPHAMDTTLVQRELRMFAVVFRASQRDGVRRSLARLHDAAGVVTHVDAGRDVLARYRSFRAAASSEALPVREREALLAVEDFLSLQAIEGWYALLAATQVVEDLRDGEAAARLRATIEAETEQRVLSGLQGPLDPEDAATNERFVTRMNTLKKFILAVLHVRLLHSRRTQHVQDLLFGVAAAIAMTVAVTLQLWTAWTVGVPTGPGPALLVFVGTAVGGYILKDRMKEWLKGWFAARIPRWLHDRRTELVSEAGHLGSVEETVHLVRPEAVAPEVVALRVHGESSITAGERAHEDVVHYRRTTSFLQDGAPAEMTAVDEILRFHVERWLRRMDDPTRNLSQLQPDGSVKRIRAAKNYTVQVILRLDGELERYAVVLNKKGLVRVERIAISA